MTESDCELSLLWFIIFTRTIYNRNRIIKTVKPLLIYIKKKKTLNALSSISRRRKRSINVKHFAVSRFPYTDRSGLYEFSIRSTRKCVCACVIWRKILRVLQRIYYACVCIFICDTIYRPLCKVLGLRLNLFHELLCFEPPPPNVYDRSENRIETCLYGCDYTAQWTRWKRGIGKIQCARPQARCERIAIEKRLKTFTGRNILWANYEEYSLFQRCSVRTPVKRKKERNK